MPIREPEAKILFPKRREFQKAEQPVYQPDITLAFIYVNKFDDGTGDLSRERKESFYWYKKVIESNGEDLG